MRNDNGGNGGEKPYSFSAKNDSEIKVYFDCLRTEIRHYLQTLHGEGKRRLLLKNT